MDIYTVFICDDNDSDMQRVAALIRDYGEKNGCIFSLVFFSSGQELIKAIEKGCDPNIIFLDIKMEETDGIETAARVREFLPEVPIALVTAYLSYALEGYKVKAARFLIKDELEETISECLGAILSELGRRKRELTFSFVEGKIRLKLDDIAYIETDAHVQIFHVGDREYRIYKKLSDVERELSPYGFVRIHKSFVVNLLYVRKISGYRLYLNTGEDFSVPRDRYSEVKRKYALYRGRKK